MGTLQRCPPDPSGHRLGLPPTGDAEWIRDQPDLPDTAHPDPSMMPTAQTLLWGALLGSVHDDRHLGPTLNRHLVFVGPHHYIITPCTRRTWPRASAPDWSPRTETSHGTLGTYPRASAETWLCHRPPPRQMLQGHRPQCAHQLVKRGWGTRVPPSCHEAGRTDCGHHTCMPVTMDADPFHKPLKAPGTVPKERTCPGEEAAKAKCGLVSLSLM